MLVDRHAPSILVPLATGVDHSPHLGMHQAHFGGDRERAALARQTTAESRWHGRTWRSRRSVAELVAGAYRREPAVCFRREMRIPKEARCRAPPRQTNPPRIRSSPPRSIASRSTQAGTLSISSKNSSSGRRWLVHRANPFQQGLIHHSHPGAGKQPLGKGFHHSIGQVIAS